MELKYTRRRMVRLTPESDDKLIEEAGADNNKRPAELARDLIDEGLARRKRKKK